MRQLRFFRAQLKLLVRRAGDDGLGGLLLRLVFPGVVHRALLFFYPELFLQLLLRCRERLAAALLELQDFGSRQIFVAVQFGQNLVLERCGGKEHGDEVFHGDEQHRDCRKDAYLCDGDRAGVLRGDDAPVMLRERDGEERDDADGKAGDALA